VIIQWGYIPGIYIGGVGMEVEKTKMKRGIMITPPRKVINLGGSKAVTIPTEWLKFQKWQGRDIKEFSMICNDIIILIPFESKIDEAIELLQEYKRIKEERI